MLRLVPSQTALVLGGGGAKGAYQIGVIKALESMGVSAGMAFGTSIGALNAAMYAQGGTQNAQALWESLRLSDIVTPESIEMAEEAEFIFSRPDKLLDFITKNAQKKGLDTRPLFALIREAVHEDSLRKSRTRFGLTATRFPSLTQTEKRLEDMAPGTLHDWLMASTACFPAIPMKAIGNERYLDGGFTDNVPVSMAIRAGAKHIIAVDIGQTQAHSEYAKRPNITYIRASHPLGGLLAFDPERSRRNISLGYNDTLRAFSRLRGTHYSFDSIDAQRLHARAEEFIFRLTAFEANMNSRRNPAPLFSLLEDDLRPGADAIDYFLRALELCAQTLSVDPVSVYTFDRFCDALQANLPLEEANAMLASLLGGRIGVLFAPPQPDRALVLACLYQILKKERSFSTVAMRTLSTFPRELLCALTLQDVLRI